MQDITTRLARLLKDLRRDHGWTLDDLARRSGVSRATLSRLENAGVSPTAEVLARLGAAYGLSLSRLMAMIEGGFRPLVTHADQPEREDPETGVSRRTVSPAVAALSVEIVEYHLPPDTRHHAAPAGPEHHLVMLDGALSVTLGDAGHDLTTGDCLRFVNAPAPSFGTGPARGARFLLVRV